METRAYNFFNQPTVITEDSHRLQLSYGANQQRNKVQLNVNNNPISTRFYISKYYEKEMDTAGIRHYHYIYGDNGAVALHIANETAGTDTMYYIHTDHLGSYCAITDENKQGVQREHFDPWGNFIIEYGSISPEEWENDTCIIYDPHGQRGREALPSFPLTHRGFTGHEHYPNFKIINMNARLYDPVIGRFFSPDNFVQIPEFSQSFNRYSYCLNNPLKYTDPTGQMWSDVLDDYGLFSNGRIELLEKTNDKFDRLFVMDDAGNRTNTQMKLFKNSADASTILAMLAETGKASDYGTSFAVGDENTQSAMLKTFKFAADNSNVEWRVDRFMENGNNMYSIGTAHSNRYAITSEQMGHSTRDVVAFVHSHPGVNSSWELGSMGWVGNGYRRNTDVGLKTQNDYYKTTLYYTYIPQTGNLWNVRSNQQPAFIKQISGYQDFWFGIFNTR